LTYTSSFDKFISDKREEVLTVLNLLSLEEAAQEGKVSIFTVRAWRHQRRFPVVKLGRRVLIEREAWEKFVRSGLVEAAPAPARAEQATAALAKAREVR
jgi:excisionase family DNA binding protein